MSHTNSWQQKFSSPDRKYEPVVFFVPNFGGTIGGMRRHIEFVNELGFDAVAIHLSYNHWRNVHPMPLSTKMEFGLRHIWSDDIERALNSVAEKKILFSFSYPSVAALQTIARRRGADIEGWICEGGPFFELFKCTWNLFSHGVRVKNSGFRALATIVTPWWLGMKNYEQDTHSYLKALPQNFPVLSIRSWQDRLVPISAIDAVFNGQNHLAYQTLALPEADHLTGLFHSPEDYKPRVAQFLKQISRQLNEFSTSESPVL